MRKATPRDRCSSLACDYKGGTDKITIQPFEASGKTKYITISLRKNPLRGGAATPPAPTDSTAGTPAPTPTETSGGGGDCDKYLERFAACEKIDAKVKENMVQIQAKLKGAPADKVKRMCDTMSAGWEKTLGKAGC